MENTTENQTVPEPKQPHETQENLLFEHQDVAESARRIAQFLVRKIAFHIGDDEQFYRLIQKSDRASLTLQRLCSIICHLIPVEQNLMGKQQQLFPKAKKPNDLTAQDFEIILHAAKQFGLLKEGAEHMVHDIIADLYCRQREREKGLFSDEEE